MDGGRVNEYVYYLPELYPIKMEVSPGLYRVREGNAMNERTNRTLEESITKYVSEHQHEWKNYLQLVTMAYRSSVHAVTKYSPAYVIFGTPLKLPIDWLYETRHTELNPTPSDFIFKTRRELRKAHHQIRIHMEEQTRQKTLFDYRAPRTKKDSKFLSFSQQ